MKKDIKLPALRRVDAATAKKIHELYPADWDMDAVFRQSYRKYQQQCGMADSEGMHDSQTGTTRQRKIRLHINRYVTAACLVLTAGIAGVIGYMRLSAAEPPAIMPGDSVASTTPLHEVLPDVTASDTEALMTDTLSGVTAGRHGTVTTTTVVQEGSDASQNDSTPSESDVHADDTGPAVQPTEVDAGTTVPKSSDTTAKNQHTTATTVGTTAKNTTVLPARTTAGTTTAPKSTTAPRTTSAPKSTTTARRTTSAPAMTATTAMTTRSTTRTGMATTQPDWSYTTAQTAAGAPVQTTEQAGCDPTVPVDPNPPSEGGIDPNNEEYGFYIYPYPDNPDQEYILGYHFEDPQYYYYPYFRVDAQGYASTVIYPNGNPDDRSFIENTETGGRAYVDFYSGDSFEAVFSHKNDRLSETQVNGTLAYYVRRENTVFLYWFDGRYLCALYTDPANFEDLMMIAEHMLTH